MVHIGIFLPHQFTSSVALALYDYLTTANLLSFEPHFEVRFFSFSDRPISYTGIRLEAETKIPTTLDVLIVVGTGGRSQKEVLLNLQNQSPSLGAIIQKIRKRGTLIATTCTSAYFLADLGLLNGKTATAAWWLIPEFKEQFPRVRWSPEKSIAVQGRLITTGAGFNGIELARTLLSRLKKAKLENKVHRILLLPEKSVDQKIYLPLTKSANNPFETKATGLLEKDWASTTPTSLALGFGMGSRTFIRRFKENMSLTPGRWLQLKRIEKAKILLRDESLSIEEACYRIGYEDPSSFTRLFQREVGLSPSEFRNSVRIKS